jgi:hypothetical protein
MDTNRSLRDENRKLKDQIAILLGDKRRNPVNDMSLTKDPRSA